VLLCNYLNLALNHPDPVNVESEGPYAPERLLIEAVSVMRDKIAVVRKAAAALEAGNSNVDVDMG
jgi:DNA-directed RNA polymerase I and III subunit RPAC1